MLLADILLILALTLFCAAWFARGARWRGTVLWVSVLAAIALGVFSYLRLRWQVEVGLGVALLFLLALLVATLRKRKPARRPWFTGALFVLLTLFSAWVFWLFPVFELPPPAGPHPVGVMDFELVDASRSGLQGAAPGDARKLKVRAWYPAGDVKGMEPRPYFTRDEAETSGRSLGAQFPGPLKSMFLHLALVDTNSFTAAPPLEGEESWPVLLYSHGYGLHLGQHTALMEHLASHGYLVYSIHHSYDGAAVRFEDGSTAAMDAAHIEESQKKAQEGLPENQLKAYAGATWDERYEGTVAHLREIAAQGERIFRSVDLWRDDQLFVYNSAAAGCLPEHVRNIARRADYSAVGHMGMSFGGSTAASACQVNPACAAVVNLDGGNQDITLVNADVSAPLLMFHHDFAASLKTMLPEGTPIDPDYGFNDLSYERFETAGVRGDIYRMRVLNSTHGGVSDMSLMLRQPLRGPLFGDIDPHEMIDIQNDVVLGFLDRHIRRQDNGFPDRVYGDHPAIVPMTAAPVRDWWLQRP